MSVTNEKFKNLIWLRWVAFASILLVLFGVSCIEDVFPIHPVSFWITLAYGFSNLLLVVLNKKISDRFMDFVLLVVLLLDTAFLTAILELNGGSNNPFTILFLATASAGALLLSLRSLIIVIIASLTSLWIIYSEVPAESMEHMHHMGNYPFHLKGMWLANSLGVLLVCGWIHYLRRMNERIAKHNEKTQKILADIERVESMGLVVAQAAHQMNTPLGTFQLGLSEIGDKQNPLTIEEHDRWIVDMQHAVDQISNIISRIRPESKITDVSNTSMVGFEDFIKEWVLHWAKPRKIDVNVECNHSPFQISTTYTTVDIGNVLTALLDNAYDATNGGQSKISVEISESNECLELSVYDAGSGMDDETKKHALDPLFTTKPKGTGLGLYVCHQIAKKYNGEVRIESKLGNGTRVDVIFKKDKL